jgi:hypothetical protein
MLVKLGTRAVAIWRRRASRWLAIPAVAATAAAGFMLAGSPPAQAQGTDVTPILQCVQLASQTITAFWGYNNPTGTTQIIPVGADNFFAPVPSDKGQPSTFLTVRTILSSLRRSLRTQIRYGLSTARRSPRAQPARSAQVLLVLPVLPVLPVRPDLRARPARPAAAGS